VGHDGKTRDELIAELEDLQAKVDALERGSGRGEQPSSVPVLSRARYQSLIENMREIIFSVDLEGRLSYVTEAVEGLTGLTVDEALGKPFSELIHPDVEADAMESWQRRMSGTGSFNSEWPVRHKDGSRRWVRISTNIMLEDGEPAGITGIAMDVTEERLAQERLRESEARHKELTDLLPQTIFEMDSTGRLVFANRAAFDAFGYDESDLERGVSVVELILPEDRLRAAQAIAQRVAGEDLGSKEYTAVRKDGSTFPCMVLASPIVREGAPVGVRGILVDISAQKSVEQELARRNADLVKVNEELARSSRVKDEFIATVSHELRTPLVTGIGYVELLLEGHLGAVPEEVTSAMGVAEKNLKRLRVLVDDILNYDELIRKDMIGSATPEPFELCALLVESAAELRARTGRPQESMEVDCPDDLTVVHADEAMIHAVLSNLLDNAHRHGGDDALVSIRARLEGDQQVHVSVSDDGRGMPPEVVERAFDPFFKKEERAEGSGLGLALVQRILAAHGTDATIESAPDGGTTVSFLLAVSPA